MSGRLILPTNDQSPTIGDICLGLSRMPRFAGQTRCTWTVAHHSLVCEALARRYLVKQASLDVNGHLYHKIMLDVLLHDAHEAVIGDIPTPWKTDAIRDAAAQLDRRIYADNNLALPNWESNEVIQLVDYEALLAEGAEIGPVDFIPIAQNNVQPSDEGVNAVLTVLLVAPDPDEARKMLQNAIVHHIKMYHQFLKAAVSETT